MTAALRQLTLGVSAESTSECVYWPELTPSECMKRFCEAVVKGLKQKCL